MGIFGRRKNESEEQLLLSACYRGDIEYVKEYISSGKSLEVSVRSETPLIMAISQYHEEIVKLLLENGADVNFSPDNTFLPLHSAINSAVEMTYPWNGKMEYEEAPTEIIELLIDKGVDVNKKTKYGLTPFATARFLTTKSGSPPQNIIDLLVAHGAGDM